MLAEDGRVFSLNLSTGLIRTHKARRRDSLVGTVPNPPCAVPDVTSPRVSRRTSTSPAHQGSSGGHHGRNAKQQPTKLAGSCQKRSTPCRRLTVAKRRAHADVSETDCGGHPTRVHPGN